MSEQSIFLAALDIFDPAERSAYLSATCGENPALRKEIEALLAAHARPGPFLDEPAVAQMAASGAGETRTVVPGVEPDLAETRSPDADGSGDHDVLAFLQPPTRAGSLGRLAPYEVQEVLGRGGFGTVLKAFDDRLHRVVAIKVMAPQLAASGAARARFLREARSAAAVRDEHVVNVHAVSDDGAPIPYLVMELVAGQTLQQKLDKVGPLPVAEVLRIGGQIARGLAAAHATGLIHRDIKPANILLENGVERVKITDFGLARAADDASISQSGVVAGTPQYMAPEQARGDAIDHRADLFSLGSVLYAMCTGRPPFRAETTLAVLKRVCEDAPRPVREVNPATPQWLADVVAKLHAKKPEERFQTAKEAADLLAQYLTELQMHGVVTPETPARPVAPAARPSRGRRWKWAAAALVLPALALSAVWFAPAAVRYLGNRADIEFVSDSDVLGYDLLPGVTSEVAAPQPVEGDLRALRFSPGAYRIEAKCKPGREVDRWEVTTHGPFTARTQEHGSGSLLLSLGRGDRVTVRPVLRDATPAPPPTVAPFDAAKAKEYQEKWAAYLGVLVEDTNAVGMKLRLIPPGEFAMGSSKQEIDWLLTEAPDLKDAEGFIKDWVRGEGPDRRVTVREPFLLGAHEVTVGQFRAFVKATGHKSDAEKRGGGFVWDNGAKAWERKPGQVWSSPEHSGSENHPVKFVTADDVRAFCDWLGEQDGRKYAIPTEEQWEYACRAGTATRWSFGDDPGAMRKYGWTAPHAGGTYHPVGQLAPNPFGLFDMYGNVGELVLTARGEEYQRGGTATETPQRARSASRVPVRGDLDPIATRGFRVAVVGDLKPKPKAPAKAEPNPAVVAALKDAIAAKTRARDVATIRFEAGKDSMIEVLAAETELVDARVRLAEEEQKPDTVIELLEQLVKLRREERDLIAARVEAGVDPSDALAEADSRLAAARVRLARLRPPLPVAPPPRPKP